MEEKKDLVQRVKHIGLNLRQDCRWRKVGEGKALLECLAKPEGKKYGFYPAYEIIDHLEGQFIKDRIDFIVQKLLKRGVDYSTMRFEDWDITLKALLRNELPTGMYPQELTEEDYQEIFKGIQDIWVKEYKAEESLREVERLREQVEREERLLEEAETDIHLFEEYGEVCPKKGERWEVTRKRYLHDYGIDIGKEE
jgi:hypothetical protein